MMRALMEEEELRKIAAQRAFNEKMLARNRKSALKNQTAMTQDDVGFFPGLLGRSSEAEQRMLAGNMYPGPQLSLFDRAKNALSDAWTNENSSFKQGLLVDKMLDEKETLQAAQAMAAKYNAMNNFGDESADFDANAVYNMGNMADENRFGTGARQLSNAEAGAIYSQPLQTNDEIAEYGAGNTGFLNKNAQFGYMGSVGDMLGRLRYNEDGTFSRSPTVGTRAGDVAVDLGRAAYQNSRIPYIGMKDMAGDAIVSPEQLANDQIDRIEAEREYNLPENVALREAAKKREEMKQAGLLVDQQLDAIEAERDAAKAEEMKAAGIWATEEIVRQETEQLAAKRAAEAEAQRLAEAERVRNMQGFIEQQSEMESGYNNMQEAQAALETVDQSGADNESFDTPIIGEEPISVSSHVLPAVEKKIEELSNDEKNDLFVDKTLRGEGLLGKFLDKLGLLDNDNEGVSEADGDATVNDIAVIAAESGDEAAQEAGQAGLLTEDKTTDTKNNNVFNAAVAGSEGASNSGIMSVTSDDSMQGFTMDRLTNPLSPENKKWWMGGGGGVPGSNRAVQFFEALAYIGTPLKYRPSKTPGQQNIENQMTQMNNLMDYRASVASSSASANQNTFTKLKAAIPSTTDLEKSLAPAFFEAAGIFEKESETKRKIEERAYELHEKMTILASQGIYPTLERVYADEAEAERIRKEEEAKNKGNELNEDKKAWWDFS